MEFLFHRQGRTLGCKVQGFPVLKLFLGSILLSVLPLACTPAQEIAVVASSPVAGASIALPSDSHQPVSPRTLGPGRLRVTAGPPIEPKESLAELFIYTKQGVFPIALRRSLASKAVEAVEKHALAGEYAGQKLVRQTEHFLTIKPKKPWTQKLEGKNRIATDEALIFVSPEGTLGITIGTPVIVPPSWICVGQIQVLPDLLSQWSKDEDVQDIVKSISYPAI